MNFWRDLTTQLKIIAVTLLTTSFVGYQITAGFIKPVNNLIIDTDAGGDDAMGIMLALGAEKYDNGPKVVAITCVNGNTIVANVAINVLKTLSVSNRLDIPVYKGAERPLLLQTRRDYYFGMDGFGDFNFTNPPCEKLIRYNHAVNAMIEMVKTNPGQITVLALGPLTNIALAILMYPCFMKEIRQLIVMGGSVEGTGNIRPGIEFNFYTDPVANYIVFTSAIENPLVMLPWETSIRSATSIDFWKSLESVNSTQTRLAASANRKTFTSETKHWNSPDTVTSSVAVTSGEIVSKIDSYYASAIYEGSQTSGMIVVDRGNTTKNSANTLIIDEIDVARYRTMVLKYLS